MKIEDLSPVSGSVKNTKRRGRGPGTGLGKTGGRGHKGAGARSGFKRRAWLRWTDGIGASFTQAWFLKSPF